MQVLKSVFFMYIAWMSYFIFRSTYFWLIRDFESELGVEMPSQIIYSMVLANAVIALIGGVLAWYTQKKSKLAKWLFIAYCASNVIDTLSGFYFLSSPELSRIIIMFLHSIAWLYLLTLAYNVRYNNANQH